MSGCTLVQDGSGGQLRDVSCDEFVFWGGPAVGLPGVFQKHRQRCFFLPSWLVTAIDNRYLKGDKKTRTGFPHQDWWCWVDSCVELAQKERGPETDLRKKLPVPILNCRQHGSTCTGLNTALSGVEGSYAEQLLVSRTVCFPFESHWRL